MNLKQLVSCAILVACAGAAHAVDGGAVIGGAIGGGAGAAIGDAVGGRNGAIIGGAVGGGVGAAIGSSDSDTRRSAPATREVIRYEERDGHHHKRHGSSGFCPPGQGKKGRC